MIQFPQFLAHVKQGIQTDLNGDPVIKNGQEVPIFTLNKVVNGLLSKRRQIIHAEDNSRFESQYIHNARLEPNQINHSEINGGDLLILLDKTQAETITQGLLIDTNTNQLILNPDGSLSILINNLTITLGERLNQFPFFIETVYPEFKPGNEDKLWHIRCELRRNNTSMYKI